MPMTEATRNDTLDGTYTIPGTLWLQLHTGPAGEAGTDNVAPVGRQSFTRNPASGGASGNANSMIYLPFSSGITITHWSVHTLEAGGRCDWEGQWQAPRTYSASDQAFIDVGQLVLTLTRP